MKLIIIILFALGLTVINKPAYLEKMEVKDKSIKVVFDETLMFNDLVAIKLKLESRDIYITYDEMEFNKNGQLKTVSYKLENKNEKQRLVLVNKTI